ncbi:MAG: DUF1073 domain-containing protein, partial [Bosea sp.]|nr:DUF1073 domain-containing protein [Bosea sp. (in: a-proteobacteria)]
MTKPRVRLHRDGSVTLLDGFANVISGIGGANAKQRGHGYVVDLSQHELEAAYRSSTWFGKIVDIPADDSTREWRSWKAEKEQIEAIEAEEKRLQVRQKVRQALIWSRLYGGAVIIPGGMPGQPEEPLPVDRVRRGAVKFLTVLHRHDISAQGIVRDPLSPHFGEPEHYEISTGTGQVRFHPSRVIRINGREVPNRNGGSDSWGDSVWMHLSDAILNADAGAAVIGALMQEAKTDVIRLPEMMQNMATAEYESLLVKRLTMTATLKGLSNTLLLDKDDEWDQKQITWAGLPEVMRTLLTIMAGAADIPVTRLTGEQQTGLSGSDAGSLRNYYDAVKAKQELVLSPQIRPLDELLIRSALGDWPDDIWSDWISLYQLSQKERAEV